MNTILSFDIKILIFFALALLYTFVIKDWITYYNLRLGFQILIVNIPTCLIKKD